MADENKKKRLERKSISLKDKIQILNRLKDGERVSSVAKSLKLNEATIRTIKKNEHKIRKCIVGCSFDTINTASRSDDEDGVDMNVQDVKDQNILKFDQPKMNINITDTENRNTMGKEIADIRETIWKKYKTLKTGKIDENIKCVRQYEPIVAPLKGIAVKTSNMENESNSNTVRLHKHGKCKFVNEENVNNLKKHKAMSIMPYQSYDDEKSTTTVTKNSPDLEKEDSIVTTSEYSNEITSEKENSDETTSEKENSDETTSDIENQQESIQHSITNFDNLSYTLKKCRDNNNFDYTHWDDPNELVDRLRLLIETIGVANYNRVKEILYINKELRQAGYIL